jgi:hypothetical protein
MSEFKTYQAWFANSDGAKVFRQAFEINDRMPTQELRDEIDDLISQRCKGAWIVYNGGEF